MIINCSVCGFPIMPNGCLHTVLGFTADQWRDMSDDEHNMALKVAQASDAAHMPYKFCWKCVSCGHIFPQSSASSSNDGCPKCGCTHLKSEYH